MSSSSFLFRRPVAPPQRPRASSDPMITEFNTAFSVFLNTGEINPIKTFVQTKKLPDNIILFVMGWVRHYAKFQEIILLLKANGYCDDTKQNTEALILLITKNENPQVVDWIAETLSIDWTHRHKEKPLIHAFWSSMNVQYMRIICKHDPSAVNQLNVDGKTPLQRVLSMSHQLDDGVNLLGHILACQPAFYIVYNDKKISPITYAILCGRTDLVPILYKHTWQYVVLEKTEQEAYEQQIKEELDGLNLSSLQQRIRYEKEQALQKIHEQITALQSQCAQLQEENEIEYLLHMHSLVDPLTESLSLYPLEVAKPLVQAAFSLSSIPLYNYICRYMAEVAKAKSGDSWKKLLIELSRLHDLSQIYDKERLQEMVLLSINHRLANANLAVFNATTIASAAAASVCASGALLSRTSQDDIVSSVSSTTTSRAGSASSLSPRSSDTMFLMDDEKRTPRP